MQQKQFFMPPPAPDVTEDEQYLVCGGGGGATAALSKGSAAAERKRRFTEEQIRSLESMFHAHHHAKLDAREKAELARELGLQPRQVAIWFQNKRARWRSKQREQDYAALRAKYDALHSRVESLKQDKLALTAQLHELSEKLWEREERGGANGAATTAASSSSCNGGGDEVDDDRRHVDADMCCLNLEPPESCGVLGGLVGVSAVDSDQCDVQRDYDESLIPDSLLRHAGAVGTVAARRGECGGLKHRVVLCPSRLIRL
ncbi:hypothetical protein GUJ93_ZPchr0014g46970 [Zizania palustris]|uniref:Homeobox-leucine zipper protein n=1 Tax=Zizania palustris TaxID=103762 RepID=A0A8J5SXV0_ZIZPA|nr:hypothetical protein GUJ93_ZPchr0014g46970 [Zizania palustris]